MPSGCRGSRLRKGAPGFGEKGLAEYRRLAEAAFRKLPPRGRKKGYDPERSRLSRIMDYFAEQDGDLDARIAIREADQWSPWDVLKLAEFCLQHGREEEALRRAEEGLWLFEAIGQTSAFTSSLPAFFTRRAAMRRRSRI